tara:strand:+ start:2678 stop:2971 length:294 start_codon:yes stop_codon:yes gene_type:complete
MDSTNLTSLATWINSSIKNNGHKINDPNYESLYLRVFFDEVHKNSGQAPHSAKFSPDLEKKLDKSQENWQSELTDFQSIWDAWVTVHREMLAKGYKP